MLSINLRRRHLTPSQVSLVGAKVRDYYDKLAKERQKRKPADSVPVTLPEQKSDARDAAGKAVGVSGSLVDRATKVKEKGVPELFQAVEDGQLSVTTAAKLADEDEETQKEAAKEATFTNGRFRNKTPKAKATSVYDNLPVKNYDKTEQFAIECARCAITQLEQIKPANPGREKAFEKVEKWIQSQRKKS